MDHSPGREKKQRQKWSDEMGREKREGEKGQDTCLPQGNAIRWSSAKQIVSFSNARWQHWTYFTVPPGTQVINCSSITVSMIPSVSYSSALNYH